jgi:hypothetical protein
MEGMKFWRQFCCMALFAVSIFFVSCNFGPPPETVEVLQTNARSALDRKDVLALWHLAERHETSEKESRERVQEMLQYDAGAEKRNASNITGVHSFSVTMEEGFSPVTANRRSETAKKEKTEIPFYVFYLENRAKQTNGFALTCGDARIGNVLALVENGAYDDTDNPVLGVFYACLEDYILATIELYNSIRDQDITVAMAKSKVEEARFVLGPDDLYLLSRVLYSKGPLMETEWNQGEPYSDVINSIEGRPLDDDDVSWPTGCVATAMAQIMAYHEWPLSPPATIRKPNYRTTAISGFYDPYSPSSYTLFSDVVYNWGNMKTNSKATSLSNTYKNLIGVLMLAIGDKVSMQYDTSENGGSSAYTDDVPDAFGSMGYLEPKIRSYNYEVIKDSIDQDKPVYISGKATKEYFLGIFPVYKNGHAWVIDGYQTTYTNIVHTTGSEYYLLV